MKCGDAAFENAGREAGVFVSHPVTRSRTSRSSARYIARNIIARNFFDGITITGNTAGTTIDGELGLGVVAAALALLACLRLRW